MKKSSIPKSENKGRKELDDPVNLRNTIRLTAVQHIEFLSLFEQLGMKNKSRFIIARIFGESFKVIKIDKSALDYYIKLNTVGNIFFRPGCW